MSMTNDTKGFTLVEILIAIAILCILMIIVFINLRGMSARASDIKRKTDLYTLRRSFEEYLNDKGVLPPQSVVTNCGASFLPWLAKIPCDPVSKISYGYFPAQNGGYRLCAKLSDTTDPAISSMGCGGPDGCGVGGGYNYCLATGVTASAIGTGDQIFTTPTSTPTPTGGGEPTGGFACAPADLLGNSYCKSYADPIGMGCPRSYQDSHCNNECQTHPEVRCLE